MMGRMEINLLVYPYTTPTRTTRGSSEICFAAARQRLAEWSAEQLERQVTPGAEQVIQKSQVNPVVNPVVNSA